MVDKLNQKEELELKELESKEASEDALSPEEEAELANLEALESQEPTRVPGMAESAALGALEGVPFAKDVVAAGETLLESGTNSFGENWQKNKKEWNDLINKAEQENPLSFFAGDVLGGAALIPGGALKTAGRAAMFAGASAFSRSETRDNPYEVLAGAALGGVAFKAAEGVERLGKLFVEGGKKGVPRAFGAVNPSQIKNVNSHVIKNYNPQGKLSHSEAALKFADDILKETVDGELLITTSDDLSTIAQKAARKRDIYGNEIGIILKKADETLGKPLNAEKMFNNLKREIVDPLLNSTSSKKQRQGVTFLRELQDDLLETSTQIIPQQLKTASGNEVLQDAVQKQIKFRDLSLKDMHKYLLDTKDLAGQAMRKDMPSNPIEKMLKKKSQILSRYIEEAVEDVSDEAVKGSFRAANRNFANMEMVKNISEEGMKKTLGDSTEKFQNLLRTKGMMAGLTLAKDAAGGTRAAFAIGMNQILTDPNTPTYLAKGAVKIQNLALNSPDHKLLKRLSVAASLDAETFRESLASVIGEVNLIDSAVARTTDDVLTRSDDILSALQYHNEDLAESLRSAIENKDDAAIGSIMGALSTRPEMKKYIQEGMGWDGKITSEAERIESERMINDADVSLHQKLQHKKALRLNGTIPKLQPEIKPMLQFMARDKNKPKF